MFPPFLKRYGWEVRITKTIIISIYNDTEKFSVFFKFEMPSFHPKIKYHEITDTSTIEH